ncbi:hypothetical protein [Arthrobacter sp. SAFR-044]
MTAAVTRSRAAATKAAAKPLPITHRPARTHHQRAGATRSGTARNTND